MSITTSIQNGYNNLDQVTLKQAAYGTLHAAHKVAACVAVPATVGQIASTVQIARTLGTPLGFWGKAALGFSFAGSTVVSFAAAAFTLKGVYDAYNEGDLSDAYNAAKAVGNFSCKAAHKVKDFFHATCDAIKVAGNYVVETAPKVADSCHTAYEKVKVAAEVAADYTAQAAHKVADACHTAFEKTKVAADYAGQTAHKLSDAFHAALDQATVASEAVVESVSDFFHETHDALKVVGEFLEAVHSSEQP